ncbi:quercetin 2,3-dioxygenase [Pinibacter aurantiacus]|uniref:Quercetin 2,3-dioxygenase n=1 Tax=Pinibacter aurantiacus TaxID=2851599 RepID=A0A9E2SG81_9BACT|nr:quercetin 2,3-dioxygenase [Pinibacter aurantiacus]MBV4359935.1 quercetin 2,3-dioxygenase [Pinibacter aurantiacus]
MNNVMTQHLLHLPIEQHLERSYWYGPNLATVLVSSEETNGAFSLLKIMQRKGFSPPLHVHEREDESNYILEGEIMFQIGEQTIIGRAGDFVHLPKNVPHTFNLISETASTLLLITPGGFEEMFIACGRRAERLELAPLTDKLPEGFFEKQARINEALGVRIVPKI